MLHELAHNVFSAHDANFHALWDQLRKEYEALVSKGYTGEGFLSEGQRLGGRRVPRDEAQRIARNAAEKRRIMTSGSGQKLGGRPVPAGTNIRRVIVDAIERRNTILKGCALTKKDEREIIDLTDEADSGFKTQAAEDNANDQAIAQALWDLVQEDEKEAYGKDYIQPTASNPTGNGGGEVGPPTANKREASSSPANARTRAPPIRQHPDRPVSRLVAEGSKKPNSGASSFSSRAGTMPAPLKPQTPNPIQAPDPPSPVPSATGWTCPFCTLHNPIGFLACDACTAERPEEITAQIADAERKRSSVSTTRKPGLHAQTWACSRCTTVMEQTWWTCSTCGKMKDSS